MLLRLGCPVLIATAALFATVGYGAEAEKPASPFPSRVKATEFPEGLQWVNSRPLSLKDVRGKFVLLDFWTYCCINCMHVLPELKKAEKAYASQLVVIGVHSAKFQTEQDSKNIAEAIARYEIEHPVVNDAHHLLWERIGVRAWPTLVLMDPEGYFIWGRSGEVTFEDINKVLESAVAFYGRQGVLNSKPLDWAIAEKPVEPTFLRYPGKVLADEAGARLFIADSNHNRIVVAGLDGKVRAIVGSGVAGRADGRFEEAQFNHPQGMVLSGQRLYVADTENHLIRKIDLGTRKVTTVAGVGIQSREAPGNKPRMPNRTPLNSPWDLWIHKSVLYIAMAGPHQIWAMPLEESRIVPYAGNAREDIVDGPLLPPKPFEEGFASFAQPSGLTSDGKWLYVADSEGSSIRAVPLPGTLGPVRTVVGTSHQRSARLFTFGDVDGDALSARLQHPLGVAYYQGQLYVADTYNNKIKRIDPATGSVKTLVGASQPGRTDDPPAFDEPAGISAAAGKLYVADTNNHLIRVIDLKDGARVSTLPLSHGKP
jgi:DNA-binding beta-propeller fold protein YncE